MGTYARGKYWWFKISRPGTKPLYESTKVLVAAPTRKQYVEQKAAADAIEARRITELALNRNDFPTAKNDRLFSEQAAWFDEQKIAHHKGAGREREILPRLIAFFGKFLLRHITPTAVSEYTTKRLKTPTTVTDSRTGYERIVPPPRYPTVNREIDLLKQIVASAVPEYLAASPLVGLKRLKPGEDDEETETRVLSVKDEEKILAVETLDDDDRALIILALDTLVRLGDALDLRRDNDLGDELLILNTKIKKYRVPVSKRLRKALDAIPDDGTGYFFSHRRGAKTEHDRSGSVQKMLKRVCREAGVRYGHGKGITFHALRHTGATRLIEAGVNVRVVQEIGGWANLTQLSRYTHPSKSVLKAAVEHIAAGPRLVRKTA